MIQDCHFTSGSERRDILREVSKITSLKSLSVDTAARTVVQAYTPEEFLNLYQNGLGRQFPHEITKYPEHDPQNPYHRTQVCFYQTEEQADGELKKNKYSLCSYCKVDWDGLKNNTCRKKTRMRDGQKLSDDSVQMKFYDSLKSQYVHHLNDAHGIDKNGSVAHQPFTGLLRGAGSANYELKAICPYARAGTTDPCLFKLKLNFERNNKNPYKDYFRHVAKYHKAGSKPKSYDKQGGEIFNSDVDDFIPLNMNNFNQVLVNLHRFCPKYSLQLSTRSDLLAIVQSEIAKLGKFPDVTPVEDKPISPPFSPERKRRREAQHEEPKTKRQQHISQPVVEGEPNLVDPSQLCFEDPHQAFFTNLPNDLLTLTPLSVNSVANDYVSYQNDTILGITLETYLGNGDANCSNSESAEPELSLQTTEPSNAVSPLENQSSTENNISNYSIQGNPPIEIDLAQLSASDIHEFLDDLGDFGVFDDQNVGEDLSWCLDEDLKAVLKAAAAA